MTFFCIFTTRELIALQLYFNPDVLKKSLTSPLPVILYLRYLPEIIEKFLLSCFLQVDYKHYTPSQTLGELITAVLLIYSPYLVQFLSTGEILRLFWFYFYLLDSFSPPTSVRRLRTGSPVVWGA